MLRDHLQLQESDTLEKIDYVRLANQGQEEITGLSDH